MVRFAIGAALLIAGAEALVRGSSRIALALGIPPLVVGLTVVAFGTSAPELAVTMRGVLLGDGGADVALGNVVGSNIFNVLVVLGLSAAVAPLVVSRRLVRLDVPIMIGVCAIVPLIALDGRISRSEGVALAVGAVAYTGLLVWLARREGEARAPEAPGREGGDEPLRGAAAWSLNAGLVALGLALLVVGARWLVDASVSFARALGVSELVIGLTIVAVGTSLPELATSAVAALRGEREIAVGNVVGSNIFNVLFVLGLASAFAPGGVPVSAALVNFDIPFMVAVAVACLPIFAHDHRIARWEGWGFLAYYVAYATYAILAATQHDALPRYSAVMIEFVAPLTAVTLAVLAVRALRRPGRTPR